MTKDTACKDAVDLAHLARYTGGQLALDSEILRLFERQGAQILGQLEQALSQRDLKAWRYNLHSLKGAARGIGAFAYGESAEHAEKQDPSIDPEQAQYCLNELQKDAARVSAFISAYLTEPVRQA